MIPMGNVAVSLTHSKSNKLVGISRPRNHFWSGETRTGGITTHCPHLGSIAFVKLQDLQVLSKFGIHVWYRKDLSHVHGSLFRMMNEMYTRPTSRGGMIGSRSASSTFLLSSSASPPLLPNVCLIQDHHPIFALPLNPVQQFQSHSTSRGWPGSNPDSSRVGPRHPR